MEKIWRSEYQCISFDGWKKKYTVVLGIPTNQQRMALASPQQFLFIVHLSICFALLCIYFLPRLDEFKKLNPPVDLIEGAEMEMTIRGDTLLYKNSAGGVGAITSAVFCRAMCDVYYGADAVSPAHKEEVVKGIQAL